MKVKKIFKKISFWEIIGFNLLPLILILTGTIDLYYFLMYFAVEVLFIGLFSVVKWFCYFEGSSIISRFAGSIVFMAITSTLYALGALFVMALVGIFGPKGQSLLDILYDAKILIAISFVRILIYHIHWVRDKEYNNIGLIKQFYIMVISGFGGMFVILVLLYYVGKQIENQPIFAAILFTVIVIAFELWNKFDPKKWMKADW